jgi:hypothetical protein
MPTVTSEGVSIAYGVIGRGPPVRTELWAATSKKAHTTSIRESAGLPAAQIPIRWRRTPKVRSARIAIH